MRRVALVTCYFHPNYGSMLQAFATQKILDDWGVPCENIAIDRLRPGLKAAQARFYLRHLWDPQIFSGTFLRILRKQLQKRTRPGSLGADLDRRSRCFEGFCRERFRLSPVYPNRAALTEACKNYTDLLVGSDQLWLPSNIAADYYTLSWAPEGINKISYATSFGVSALPRDQRNAAGEFLRRLCWISVRERSAAELVQQYAGRQAQLVCDPTLLFAAADWDALRPARPAAEGDYILCYFLGNNRQDRQFAQRLREKTGCRILALLHLDEYIPADCSYADETPFDVGPAELVDLIARARYVVTDSFHGSVFSILYRKTFFTSDRVRRAGMLCTNTRIDSLFETLGITGRRIDGSEPVEECLARPLDYEPVHRRLEALRTESKAYLRRALGLAPLAEEERNG